MSNTGAGPNPQTNLIISIVAPVIALIAIAVLYFTKPTLVPEPAPTAVNTTTAKLPDPGVQLGNALPGAGGAGGSAASGAAAAAGFGGPGGGAPNGGRGKAMAASSGAGN
ncbi:MAG: hypothetical protein WCK51_04060 [Armatimonadota bacterium]